MPEPKVEVKLKDKEPAVKAEPETINVPKEYYSINRGVRVEIDGDQITIDISPTIVQEIGAYHRCKVRVQYKENQSLLVVPTTPIP